jgi:hypothetical protein
MSTMLQIVMCVKCLLARLAGRRPLARPALGADTGQTTAEYALVLLGAAAIASLVITWASGTDAVGRLMDFVLAHVIGSVR